MCALRAWKEEARLKWGLLVLELEDSESTFSEALRYYISLGTFLFSYDMSELCRSGGVAFAYVYPGFGMYEI
jgi:hypothetical protein